MIITSQLKFVSFFFTVYNGIGHCFVLTKPNRGQVLFGIQKKKKNKEAKSRWIYSLKKKNQGEFIARN